MQRNVSLSFSLRFKGEPLTLLCFVFSEMLGVLNMLKRLDKIRFRGQKRDDFLDLAESPNGSDNECSDDILLRTKPSLKTQDTEELGDPAGSGALTMAAAFQDFQRSESDRLNEMKGHLEIALLEKHFLQEELRKLREETNVEKMKEELERERGKRLDLELRMNEVLKSRCVMERKPNDNMIFNSAPPDKDKPPQGETLYLRAWRWLYDRVGVYIEDFRFVPEENTVEAEEPLSAKRLTENMRRLKRGARPVTNFMRNLSALSNWHSVYTSAISFIIYMNAAWHGWAIPMFLFLAILRLSLNYLIAKGWRIQWSIVPDITDPIEPSKDDLTVSEKFQLVLDVAQKAQNLFGKMADVLEKIKNLFMWVQPEITQKLYISLWVAFLSSCILPFKLVGFMIGLYAGIKFFIIDFLFKSCPKLRDKYDTPHIDWNNLPTDPQLKERTNATMSRRVRTRTYESTVPCGVNLDGDSARIHSTKKGAFHEIFNVSENERPLPVCENGWRCCLINRDRKMPTDYIRNGMLYVTENYLCFESSSSKSASSKKNKVIKLVDITDIQKVSIYTQLIQYFYHIVSMFSPLVFGAMIHRDEAFEAIFTQYMKIITTSRPPSGSPEL
uniref:GRAM domain-containing protein n=1 Tax=Oncorhynchus tshawytscha TaxID=74940 RepID=A0A8C8DD19_ONCTS